MNDNCLVAAFENQRRNQLRLAIREFLNTPGAITNLDACMILYRALDADHNEQREFDLERTVRDDSND